MNRYYKFAPNVYLAECSQEHDKGEVIELETRRGNINQHIVYNLIMEKDGKFYYSITRADGFNDQVRAKRKAGQYEQWAESADSKAKAYHEASQEGRDFLILGEPIKVGHHSEASHRALIKRNQNRMRKMVEFSDKADYHRERAAYWEGKKNIINLSMPESLDYFQYELEQAEKTHQWLKDNPDKRPHAYALTYAKNKVNEIQKKLKLAKILWSDESNQHND